MDFNSQLNDKLLIRSELYDKSDRPNYALRARSRPR